MTDAAMFYGLFEILKKNKVYYPKNNADIYLDIIIIESSRYVFENIYQKYRKIYDKKEFDGLYYYVYVILFVDFETNIDTELYEKIMKIMKNKYFT